MAETIKFTHLTIVDLIEESAAENAGRIALICNDKKFTYCELNEQANKIAGLLIAKGIQPESMVPICLNSGIEMISGILGILKAGAAYVPIDPDYPEERINYMLGDCDAKIILSTKACSKHLRSYKSAEIIELDCDLTSWPGGLAVANPRTMLSPRNLAYVMYTSGTTGVPNGVMIEHGSVVNHLLWAKDYFQAVKDDVVLQKTTFCFDVSVWEIFWPLITGLTLVAIDKDEYKDVERLKAILNQHKVTIIHFVPTMLEFFLTHLNPGECSTLKHVISSGEALTPFQVALASKNIPGAQLYNLYGPTETTIHSTYWKVPRSSNVIDKVAIGKPVANTEIFILNESKSIQEIGGSGEIYISGLGLARGYLNKRELSLAAFLTLPLGSGQPTRVFKTGDFGRYLPNGDIEYLGRTDDQIKINGYRIELESIASHINSSGLVKHCVVISKNTALGTKQIVAYVVLKSTCVVQQLWEYLAVKLPDHMLPTSIKDVKSIPFNSNGKVDKDLLLEMYELEEENNKHVPPQSKSEHQIFAIWTSLFKTDQLSVHDNFFELGGNSIMAVKMLSLLKQETGKHISYLLLNQYSTIYTLAKLLDKQSLSTPGTLMPVKPFGNRQPVYVINGGGAVTDGFFELSDVLSAEQPVYGFESNGCNDDGKVFKSIEEVASFYLKSVLENERDGPYSLAGYSVGGIIAFEMAKQLKAMGKNVKVLVMIDSLTRDPEIIKTKYNAVTVLKIAVFNVLLLRYGLSQASKYSIGVCNAAIHKLKNKLKKRRQVLPENTAQTDFNFDVFGLHISLYQKYNIVPYDGNLVVFRAKRATSYMDDFKYLGWKPFAKEVKSVAIDGDHFSIFADDNIAEFGKKLQSYLDQGF